MMLLELRNLHVEIDGREILNGVDLRIGEGEVHTLLGPNGSGKTTLVNAIIGCPRCKVKEGEILFKGKNITDLPSDERARLGIGVAFQHAPKLRGVRLGELLLKIAEKRGSKFDLQESASKLKMLEHLDRDVNVGFSGGEMRRCEIIQLMAQSPDFVMLDEVDSGVDVESISILAKSIEELIEAGAKPSERRKGALLITHLGHILNYLRSDRAHVMIKGKIACSGPPSEIVSQIMKHGFERCAECLRE